MPELGQINIVTLLGGPVTLAGFAWLARMFILYQRDFTNQYRTRLGRQEERINRLDAEQERLRRLLLDCTAERQALRATVIRAGIHWDWDASPWDLGDSDDDPT